MLSMKSNAEKHENEGIHAQNMSKLINGEDLSPVSIQMPPPETSHSSEIMTSIKRKRGNSVRFTSTLFY